MAQNATTQKARSEDGFSINGLAPAKQGVNTQMPAKRNSIRFRFDGDQGENSDATPNLTGRMPSSHAAIIRRSLAHCHPGDGSGRSLPGHVSPIEDIVGLLDLEPGGHK